MDDYDSELKKMAESNNGVLSLICRAELLWEELHSLEEQYFGEVYLDGGYGGSLMRVSTRRYFLRMIDDDLKIIADKYSRLELLRELEEPSKKKLFSKQKYLDKQRVKSDYEQVEAKFRILRADVENTPKEEFIKFTLEHRDNTKLFNEFEFLLAL